MNESERFGVLGDNLQYYLMCVDEIRELGKNYLGNDHCMSD